MSTSEKRVKRGAQGRRGVHGAVDGIVESVLDAADEEILAEIGDGYGERRLGGKLLGEMMLDVLGRYYARQQCSAALATGKEAS